MEKTLCREGLEGELQPGLGGCDVGGEWVGLGGVSAFLPRGDGGSRGRRQGRLSPAETGHLGVREPAGCQEEAAEPRATPQPGRCPAEAHAHQPPLAAALPQARATIRLQSLRGQAATVTRNDCSGVCGQRPVDPNPVCSAVCRNCFNGELLPTPHVRGALRHLVELRQWAVFQH